MTIGWIVVSSILGLVWLAAAAVFTVAMIDSGVSRAEFQTFAAVMAGALVVVAFWPVVLASIIPAFFIYGVACALKRPWRKL